MPGPIQSAISGVMNTALAGAVAGKHLKEQQEQKEDALRNTIIENHEAMVKQVGEESIEEARAEVDAALNAAPGEDTQLGKNLEGLELTYDEAVESRASDISVNRLKAYYSNPARQTELAYTMGKVSYEDAVKARQTLFRQYANLQGRVFAGIGRRTINNGSKND